MKNWTGDSNSIFKTLGASSHTKEEREQNDYYATDPIAIKLLFDIETFKGPILEPACGEGHLSKAMESMGMRVWSSDAVQRGYGEKTNFFNYRSWTGDIITNPPYKIAQKFIEHSMRIIPDGYKVAMFLKVQFLEGKARKILFKNFPPKVVYVSSSRILCAKNGDFAKIINGKRVKELGKISSSAVAYAWYVWEKGYQGDTILKWIN